MLSVLAASLHFPTVSTCWTKKGLLGEAFGLRTADCELRRPYSCFLLSTLSDMVFLFQTFEEGHVAFGKVLAFFGFHFMDGGVDFVFDVAREAAVG